MSKRDVRSDVLEAVYDVCERFGLENLTTKKLGDEAHCSEAMIYYHFKTICKYQNSQSGKFSR